MPDIFKIKEGHILKGSIFNEPMRVKTVRFDGTGTILLTPNERRVAEDRRDCYWLYIVTNCAREPVLQEPVRDPARLRWHEVKKVAHYWLQVDALGKPMKLEEAQKPYGGNTQ